MINQFLCFSGVGAIGTTAHYMVLLFSVEFLLIDPVVSSVMGFVVGAIVNYTLNYYITFKSKTNHYEAGTKFFFIALIGGIVNSLLMLLLVKVFGINYIFSQILSTGIILFGNFFVSRVWVFNDDKLKNNTQTILF